MIEWPEQIVDDIARRRAVLFIGSGVSKNAVGLQNKTPPTWVELLNIGLNHLSSKKSHVAKLIKEQDLLTACEIIKDRLDHQWERLLDAEFVAPRYQSQKIHSDLFKLDTRLVLTPNFDKIYDTFAQNESKNTVQIKCYYDEDIATILRGDSRAVVKVHGTIDSKPRMVFTRQQYARARYDYPAFYAVLDALLLTHTFVFIGCSLADPDMQMFLEKYSHTYPGSRPHFIVMPKGLHIDIINSVKKNLNLFPLLYNPKNNHEELGTAIGHLVSLVEKKRTQFAASHDW